MRDKDASGAVYWVTGLSGAGKTTIGRELYRLIRKEKDAVLFLDGDTMREVFGNDLGYGMEDRRNCAMRYSRLCRMIAMQGVDVVCCTISMFGDVRAWNRTHIENYREIYIRVPLEILRLRDQKGLYSRAETGEENDVVGMDLALELPENPDIIVDNQGGEIPEDLARRILDSLRREVEEDA